MDWRLSEILLALQCWHEGLLDDISATRRVVALHVHRYWWNLPGRRPPTQTRICVFYIGGAHIWPTITLPESQYNIRALPHQLGAVQATPVAESKLSGSRYGS
ncbi:hypothetical protein BV20DRAFT_964322 [Pilatotrama ljubarskyi]|nr:hypothetical protein BV20DRAFT_964322 [Pilatotrama ljubarskyi]